MAQTVPAPHAHRSSFSSLLRSLARVDRKRPQEAQAPIVDERRRLDALFGSPEAWEGLPNSELRTLLREQCLTYGATKDDRRGYHVHTLHRFVMKRLDIQARVALFQDILRTIARIHTEQQIVTGLGHTKALGSFLFVEKDANLVSSAAAEFASLLPPEGHPLRGPMKLIAESQSAGDGRRGSLLAGLARLGDRRVLALVDVERKRLGTGGQAALLQSHFYDVTAGWADVLVGWLEEAALRDPSATLVADIAQSLADLPATAGATTVEDIQRRFPGTDILGDEPTTIVKQWTLARYATERLTPRFIGLARMGVDHRLVWGVLKAWGLKGEELRLRNRGNGEPAAAIVKVVA